MHGEENGGASDGILANRYRLESKLGQGGMGAVWRAYDLLLQRQVAVKQIIFPHGMPEETRQELCARMLREARAAARLSHPGIVTVHDVFEQDTAPWVVMQLVEAQDLGAYLRTKGPMTVLETAELGLQLIDALRDAHGAGVCHRDIKPGNILMTPRGPVLVDFGIATLQDATGLTQSGALVGTPQYMAPELLEGGRATPASDLWALGVTLCAALQGGPSPFDRGSLPAVVAAVLHASLRLPQASGPLAPVLEGLLCKDPAVRLDANAAASLLAGAIHEQEAMSENMLPGPTATESRKRSYREPRFIVPLAAVLGVMTAAVAGAYFSTVPQSELGPVQETTSTPSPSLSSSSSPALSSAPTPSTSVSAYASATASAQQDYQGYGFKLRLPAGWSVAGYGGGVVKLSTGVGWANVTITKAQPAAGVSAGNIKQIAKQLQAADRKISRYKEDYGRRTIGTKYIHAVEWGYHIDPFTQNDTQAVWHRKAVVHCAGKYRGAGWWRELGDCKDYFVVNYYSFENSRWPHAYGADESGFQQIINTIRPS